MREATELPAPAELTDDDRAWVRKHLELSGWHPSGPGKPSVDTSWVTLDRIR